MSYQNQVTIGPEFFAKAKSDYANFHWAIAREFMQNSMDCGSSKIEITIETYGSETALTVANDGKPMTQDILVNKLLALGGSGKGFNGTVGGFGKAKEVLYFCHKEYVIESGDFTITGSGAGYNIARLAEHRHGTSSLIRMDGDHTDQLSRAFKKFANFAQWDGEILINGDPVFCNLRKGSPRRDLPFGTVYTNKSHENVLIVRIGGIPMFQEWIDFNRCVIVELNGSSADVLTSNRDSLRYEHRQALSNFVRELATDKRKALKNKNLTKYRHLEGAKLRHRVQRAVNVQSLVARPVTAKERCAAALAGLVSGTTVKEPSSSSEPSAVFVPQLGIAPPTSESFAVSEPGEVVTCPVSQVSEEFVLKNTTELVTPAYYQPDSEAFSSYSRKLAQVWGRLVLQMHRLFGHEAEFGIGFVFDEDSEAEYEEGDFGRIYYIAPAKIVKQGNSESRSFKKRFQLTERNRLLSIAAHEFTHGLGFHSHDSEYAAKLTDVFAKVMDCRKDFNWCFA